MSLLGIDFEFPEWAGAVQRRFADVMRFFAAQVQTNRGLLFDADGAHNGHKAWAPLRFRGGQPLRCRGSLRKSISPPKPQGEAGPDGVVRISGDMVTIGSTLAYARMMNDGTTKMPGGVLRPKNAQALKIPLPSGKAANQRTRQIRAGSISEALEQQAAKQEKAKASAKRAKAKFERTGKQEDLEKSVKAEKKVLKLSRSEAIKKHAKITSSGRGGQGFLFLKKVKIPPRNFTDWNQQDQNEVDAALVSKLAEVMNDG